MANARKRRCPTSPGWVYAAMTVSLIPLAPTPDPERYRLALHPGLCVGPPDRSFMFGGAGLAAAVLALERRTGRPLVWATAQYLAFCRPPAVLEIEARPVTEGRTVTQARAAVHDGDRPVLSVTAALGERPGLFEHAWIEAPRTPAPDQCPTTARWRDREDDLHSRFDVRIANGAPHGADAGGQGPSADGRTRLWIRPVGDHPIDAAMLAIIADHAPSGVGAAIGRHAGGNSLDNTLRIARLVHTRWVLADIHVQALANGFAHAAISLFAENGGLMALASQSMIVRPRDGG